MPKRLGLLRHLWSFPQLLVMQASRGQAVRSSIPPQLPPDKEQRRLAPCLGAPLGKPQDLASQKHGALKRDPCRSPVKPQLTGLGWASRTSALSCTISRPVIPCWPGFPALLLHAKEGRGKVPDAQGVSGDFSQFISTNEAHWCFQYQQHLLKVLTTMRTTCIYSSIS